MKRCVLCNSAAEFVVKGTSENYCRECGEIQFGSIEILEPLEKK